MNCRYIIWDLDGTLLNTLEDLTASVNAVLTVYGLPRRTVDEVRCFVGNGVHKLIERAAPEGTSPEMIRLLFTAFGEHYARHNMDQTAPYPGIPQVLAELHRQGIGMAVVSNKLDSAVQELRAHFFADTIRTAAGDLPGRERKPAPDSTLAVLRMLRGTPEEAVFIGDSDVDIATARHAGMRCISAGWGFRDTAFLREHGATVIAAVPEDVLTILGIG